MSVTNLETTTNRISALQNRIQQLEMIAQSASSGSEETRQKASKSLVVTRRALADLLAKEARIALVTQRCHEGQQYARESLNTILQVLPKNSIDILDYFLLLSSAYIELDEYPKALELLSLANWTCVSSSEEVPHSTMAMLHRNYAKLYARQGKLDQAAKFFAKDIYFSTSDSSPEHIDVTIGYFGLANILLNQRKTMEAQGFFDKIVDIWYRYLIDARERNETNDALPEAKLHETTLFLQQIIFHQSELLGRSHIAIAEATFVLGMLQEFMESYESALDSYEAAYIIFSEHHGSSHPASEDVAKLISGIQSKLSKTQISP